MSGRRSRAPAPLLACLFALAAPALSCGHTGADTCGGFSLERQWDKRFRVTVTWKVTAPPAWKVDEQGNPSPASFGGEGVPEARELYGRVARQRCLELGFQDRQGRSTLEWRAQKQVVSVSTCADPAASGQRFYAIRIWGDRISCQYVEYL